MHISSRFSGLAVLATVVNLIAVLFLLCKTHDDRLVMVQLHLVAEIQFLVIISWLLAKLLIPEAESTVAG
jgi:phage shock protein PspC (stress-responsive transcriptional regulator)